MAKNDDELLMGTPVLTDKTARDSDGDGVSDVEEELAGTDPHDADDAPASGPILRPLDDPRGDPDRPGLEMDVVFDREANMPEGKTITGGLDGLKNVDGSDLATGTNHYGIGEDKRLDGHGTSENPIDMQRDPTVTPRPTGPPSPGQGGDQTIGDGGSHGGSEFDSGPGSTPPEGADLSFRAPNMGLVGGWRDEGGAALQNKMGGTAATPAKTPEVVRPPGDTPVPRNPTPQVPDAGTPKPPKEPMVYTTNPDADGGDAGPSDGEIDRAIVVHGGNKRPVEGDGAGPEIEGDAPPPNKRDLVTDPGDEAGDIGPTRTLSGGAPDAPVVHTINPDAGVHTPPTGGPPPGGGDGGQGDGLMGISAAATAEQATAEQATAEAPTITAVGSGGGGGIHSTADAGEAAVDSFTTEYLEDAPPLEADLGADLSQVPEHLEIGAPDVDLASPDPGAQLDDGPGLDDGFD